MANYAGPVTTPDGLSNNASVRVGRDSAAVVQDAHGKYVEQSTRGRAFFGVGASAGIALIVPATTGGHPTLWNPYGSGVYVSIFKLELSYVSGNNAPTSIEWAITRNTGNTVGTGLPIATATLVTPDGCAIGGTAGAAAAKWSPTTNTFTAAPVYVRPTGLALNTAVAASTIVAPPLIVLYDGDLILAPGTAISLCTQAATTTALFQPCVAWEEIPV